MRLLAARSQIFQEGYAAGQALASGVAGPD
jgi:hypothetical protein